MRHVENFLRVPVNPGQGQRLAGLYARHIRVDQESDRRRIEIRQLAQIEDHHRLHTRHADVLDLNQVIEYQRTLHAYDDGRWMLPGSNLYCKLWPLCP